MDANTTALASSLIWVLGGAAIGYAAGDERTALAGAALGLAAQVAARSTVGDPIALALLPPPPPSAADEHEAMVHAMAAMISTKYAGVGSPPRTTGTDWLIANGEGGI